MKSTFILFLWSSIVLSSLSLSAQEYRAIDYLEKGNKHYNKDRYEKAFNFYMKALEADSNNAKANLYVGIELLESQCKWKALQFLKKAYLRDSLVSEQIHYLLGLAHQYNMEFMEALRNFHKAKSNRQNNTNELITDIDLRIEQCKTGIYLKTWNNFHVENLGPEINSPYGDYAPVVDKDGKFIFTSNRSEQGKNRKEKFFLDIYTIKQEEDVQKADRVVSKSLNSRYTEVAMTFVNGGNSLLVYKDENNGDIQISHKIKGEWTKPADIGVTINTKDYLESSACLSVDGQSLYFISNRPGGMGGTDIYVSKLQSNGLWGEAVNLGPEINTPANEESPFISRDGTILFFSSEGHLGIGGFDIFYSLKGENTKQWMTPMNMGLSVNSPQDDMNFVISGDGFKAFFSAVRPDTYGNEDIYEVGLNQERMREGSTLMSKLIKNTLPDGCLFCYPRWEVSSRIYESPMPPTTLKLRRSRSLF